MHVSVSRLPLVRGHKQNHIKKEEGTGYLPGPACRDLSVSLTSLTLVGPINVYKHLPQEENKMNRQKKRQSCEPKETEQE